MVQRHFKLPLSVRGGTIVQGWSPECRQLPKSWGPAQASRVGPLAHSLLLIGPGVVFPKDFQNSVKSFKLPS